jgi:hypothetical protein
VVRQENLPIIDYAKPHRGFCPWQVLVALPPLLFAPMTMCMCGHMDWLSFPFTVTAASLSWWAFARGRQAGSRILVIAVMTLASLALAKNVADLLWFGHKPLLWSVG